MPEYQIRPIGRPKIERGSNGLRKITRRYVVQGEAVAAGNIESHVFLTFGTVDAEYASLSQTLGPGYESGTYTSSMGSETINAYLIQQFVEPSEEVTQAYLTRVYQELDATPDPVQVDKDQVVVSDSGRISLTRRFIVKNPYTAHYDPSRIGTDFITVTHGGTSRKCFLGKVESKETEVFTEYAETFFEDAVLSQTTEYRNGLKPDHKLEIRTIRAISGATALNEPSSSEGPGDGRWYLVSEREGPGSADFGQSGKPVSTRVWAKGRGIINEARSIKHNGALEIVNIRSLGEESTVDDAGSSSSGVPFNKISTSEQKSSGHLVYMTTYAAGFGRISRSTKTKGDLEVRDETWVTQPGGPHGSELENILSFSVSKRDGYDIHTISGTDQESGIIDVRRQYKHNGDLEIVTIRSLGKQSTHEDCGTGSVPGGASFVRISEAKDESGTFVVYTDTYAAGKGEIQTSTRNTGSLDVSSFVSINQDFPADSYDQNYSDRDGYILRSYKTYSIDSGFAANPNESKQWINKYVYRQSTQTVTSTEPTAAGADLATAADKISASYSKQAPEIWRTTESDVTVDSAGVISHSIRYRQDGTFQHTKIVVSDGSTDVDALAGSYAPSSSVLVGAARSYERGWVRDQFNWISLGGSTTTTVTDVIPWTLPGMFKVSTDGNSGKLSKVNPSQVQIPVVKSVTYSLTQPAAPSVLGIPWAGLDINVAYVAKKDPYILEETLNNWTGIVGTTSIPMWEYFKGFKIATHEVSVSGWTPSQYNAAATDAYLSSKSSVAFTDGTNTIYRLETVQGSPVVDTSQLP